MTTTQLGSSSIDTGLRAGIQQAVERTLNQVCDATPEIDVGATPPTGEGVTATIGYHGDSEFTLLLAVPRATAGPLMRQFTGVPIDFDADVMEDVTGELLNVLAGDVVAELSSRGLAVSMTLPSVTRSLDFDAIEADKRKLVDFGLSGECGPYHVAVFGVPGEDGET